MTRQRLGIIAAVACAFTLVVAAGGQVLGRTVAGHWVAPSHRASAPSAGGGSEARPDLPPVRPTPSSPPSRTAMPSAKTGEPTTVPATTRPARPTASGRGPAGSLMMTGTSGVALTFDDGPSATYTPQTLDLLRAYGIKATFCLIGKNVQSYPQLVQRIVREGHALCNHTWSHDLTLGQKTDAEIRSDLQRTNDAIHLAVPGATISYFRHPGGNFTPRAVRIAAELGMTSIYWDVDPRDWSNPGAWAISQSVISRTRAGSIVLMHDGGGDRSQTVTACKTIFPNLKSRFRLIPLPPRQPL